MYYHFHCTSGFGTGFSSWNRNKDIIIKERILPFVNKQIIPIDFAEGVRIYNFNSVENVVIFKTEFPLKAPVTHLFTLDEEFGKYFSGLTMKNGFLKILKEKGLTISEKYELQFEKELNIFSLVIENNIYKISYLFS